MFYLKYLFAEIFRRFGKTITIVTGLAVASGIIITIISFSKSLSDSQKTVLNPLENVGTDIMVTRSVGSDGVASLDQATRQEYQKENRVTMDFAKLGNPGDSFSNDQFMSGTMLTYDSSVTDKVDKNQVANFAQGLILNITHQEGTIPKVTAQFETGGETIDVDQKVTDEQRQAMEDAFRKAEEAVRAKGIDPRSEEGRAAMKEALGDSMPSFKTQIKTQRRTYTQDVGPISTDVKTENYTISGVDTSKTDIGLILPSQITIGSWFSGEDNQIIINKSYADKYGKKVGDEIILSNTKYKVIGIVEPKL